MRLLISIREGLFLTLSIMLSLAVVTATAETRQKPGDKKGGQELSGSRNPNSMALASKPGPALLRKKGLAAKSTAVPEPSTASLTRRIYLPMTTDTVVVNATYDSTARGFGSPLTAGGNITLRSAIESVLGNTSTTTVIIVPAGTYILSIPGNNEQLDLSGDLDINGDAIIRVRARPRPSSLIRPATGASISVRVHLPSL